MAKTDLQNAVILGDPILIMIGGERPGERPRDFRLHHADHLPTKVPNSVQATLFHQQAKFRRREKHDSGMKIESLSHTIH